MSFEQHDARRVILGAYRVRSFLVRRSRYLGCPSWTRDGLSPDGRLDAARTWHDEGYETTDPHCFFPLASRSYCVLHPKAGELPRGRPRGPGH